MIVPPWYGVLCKPETASIGQCARHLVRSASQTEFLYKLSTNRSKSTQLGLSCLGHYEARGRSQRYPPRSHLFQCLDSKQSGKNLKQNPQIKLEEKLDINCPFLRLFSLSNRVLKQKRVKRGYPPPPPPPPPVLHQRLKPNRNAYLPTTTRKMKPRNRRQTARPLQWNRVLWEKVPKMT
jgi:hypothetical protein